MGKPRAVPMSNAVLRLFELQIIRDSRPLSAMVLAIYSAVRHLSPAKRAARRANPKDFAYSVYREWGPKSRIPRPERLRTVFGEVPQDAREAWLSDFEAVDKLVWDIAAAGGPQILGDAAVRQQLNERFPFLGGPGLNAAFQQAAYLAWHEGFDASAKRRSSSS